MADELKQLSTYIRESDPMYQAIMAEAKDKAASVSRVIYWALRTYFRYAQASATEWAEAAQPQRPAPQAQEQGQQMKGENDD